MIELDFNKIVNIANDIFNTNKIDAQIVEEICEVNFVKLAIRKDVKAFISNCKPFDYLREYYYITLYSYNTMSYCYTNIITYKELLRIIYPYLNKNYQEQATAYFLGLNE